MWPFKKKEIQKENVVEQLKKDITEKLEKENDVLWVGDILITFEKSLAQKRKEKLKKI